MRPPNRTARLPIVLAFALTLAGCGASATARTPVASPAATATPTPVPMPTATPPWTTLPTCGLQYVFDYAKRLGDTDFVVAGPELSNLAYPGKQVPDGTALKPLRVDAHPVSAVEVNPSMEAGGGYNFTLCNGSPTRSHLISAVTVRIDSLAPYTGQLSEWRFCNSAAYHPGSSGVFNGGCGGGNPNDEWMKATFSSGAASGATVVAAQVGAVNFNTFYHDQPPYAPLPVSVSAGKAIAFNVALDLPNPSATYTFSVGISLDGAPPVFSAPTDPVLLAPVAHYWDGAACLAPDMKSQIPPDADPQSAYICPES